jgi:N-acetyl-anhydromuramyl-L-alanine amidase AmpD
VAGDYWRSTFYGAHPNNYTVANRPYSNRINKIIIHVTQGSYSSALNWFNDPRAYVSAHYTVSSRYGVVGQPVREKNIAWHAGNWYYNQTSIGIEHEGYVSDPKWFTDRMYRSSAELSAYLCKKYRIPVDRYHIIGHYQVPYATHTDPGYGNGTHWDWPRYMYYVRYYRAR